MIFSASASTMPDLTCWCLDRSLPRDAFSRSRASPGMTAHSALTEGKATLMATPKNQKPPLTDKMKKIPAGYGASVDHVYADALQHIVGLANNGAMLGHDHAYDACRKIEAIATEALRVATNSPREPEGPIE